MAQSASRNTSLAIARAKALQPVALVNESTTDTTAPLYRYIHPMSVAAAQVGATTEQLLFALSYLASRGTYLDNVCRGINVKRLRDETDSSLRRNAAKIFVPESTFDTELDPDNVLSDTEALDTLEALNEEELFARMRATFTKMQGKIGDLPNMIAYLWRAVAVILREFGDYNVNIATNYAIEDSAELADTDWFYRFAAMRWPGVRDAVVQITDYNELTLWVLIDERPGRDARRRKVYYEAGTLLQDAHASAERYLPQPTQRTLEAPKLRVLPAAQRPVGVVATFGGTASTLAVRQAIQDAFYEAQSIGGTLTPASLTTSLLAAPGVSSFVLGSPTSGDLELSDYEVAAVGHMDLRRV